MNVGIRVAGVWVFGLSFAVGALWFKSSQLWSLGVMDAELRG